MSGDTAGGAVEPGTASVNRHRRSLHQRLMLVAAAVLAGFLLTIGLVLDNAFRASADGAQRDRLQGAVFTILAGIDVTATGINAPGDLPDPRLALPGSGLYAWVLDDSGREIWHSPSAIDVDRPAVAPQHPGGTLFTRPGEGASGQFSLAYGVAWEMPGVPTRRFTVLVAESPATYRRQIGSFRRSLWVWLGAGAGLLLIAQFIALRWTLAPLRRVTQDLSDVESGDQDVLSEDYPREIARLTHNLNTLIHAERERSRRHRESLDNLAHSLKTPLAVLRGALDSRGPDDLDAARDQIGRIDRSIEYHVRRRANAGGAGMGPGVALRTVTERLVRTLERAYADKPVAHDIRIPDDTRFAGSEDDLMEILGNLLDNAWKWCRSSVRVEAVDLPATMAAGNRLELAVSDDGPGIPAQVRDRVTGRGVRLDEQVPGEGIGLAVVRDLVAAYDGRLILGAGPEGGARIAVELPAHRAGRRSGQ